MGSNGLSRFVWLPARFGRRLRELRCGRGLTQMALARLAGVSNATVSRLEAGQQEPAWPVVAGLAAALGVDTDAFLAAPGAKPPAPRRGRPPKARAGKGRGGA